MTIASLLSPSLTLCQHRSSSKKRILEEVSVHISQYNKELDADTIFSALIARERLGSTGLGQGIAIPHCRISACQKTIGMLITLEKGIDFNAIDSENVDIIFVLLVPEDANDDHLSTLASVAEVFSNKETLKNIRQANSTDELISIFS